MLLRNECFPTDEFKFGAIFRRSNTGGIRLYMHWLVLSLCTLSAPLLLTSHLQDFQLWCDLREFEQKMGCVYLTHRDDEERWRSYAHGRGVHFPSHLCWDPNHDADMWLRPDAKVWTGCAARIKPQVDTSLYCLSSPAVHVWNNNLYARTEKIHNL